MKHNRGITAISCGHQAVADAANDILMSGGNAADAAVAAALCSCVVEPVLSSLGGGGLGIIWQPNKPIEAIDFWIAPPKKYDSHSERETVMLDWPGGIKQPFAVGGGSVGVWGMPRGLEALSKRYGFLERGDTAAKAIELSKYPPPLNQSQAEWMSLLHGVHTHYGGMKDSKPQAQDHFTWPGLTRSLEIFADRGADDFYKGDWSLAALTSLDGQGPSSGDLKAYQAKIDTAPSLSLGSVRLSLPLKSLTSQLLHRLSLPISDDKQHLNRSIADNLQRFAMDGKHHAGPSTTSIMVRDADGMSVALVLSNGSGSGVFAQGVQLNNVGGEIDLLQSANWNSSQDRFPTRMCPLVAQRDKQWLMLGSGGSERITSATLQVLYYNMWAGDTLSLSIAAPRMYAEDASVQIEPGAPFLNLLSPQSAIHTWENIHQYFGGVNAIAQSADGAIDACSDPRRQGASMITNSID